MSHHNSKTASAPSEPRYRLRADFTAYTISHAAIAKRRANNKQQIKAFFKEPFSMKSLKFLRTVPGAALAIAVIATTGVSAYTITNWFNGTVMVKQDNSILSVDLSQCKGNLPPGFEPGTDRSKVQFKILDNSSHITAEQLQQKSLAQCEHDAVVDFYQNTQNTRNYNLYASTVKSLSDKSITLDYWWDGKNNDKTFAFGENMTFYDQGKQAALHDLKVGDTVIYAVKVDPQAMMHEDVHPLNNTDEVKSIFKTQYYTTNALGGDKRPFYDESNIMPLNLYNQHHK